MASSASGDGSLGRQVFDVRRFGAQTVGDEQVQERLAQTFLRQADALAEALRAACEAGEPAFGDVLHTLKNTAHFVAGERLLDAVVRAEAGGGRTALPGRRRAATAVAREFALLREAIAQWLRARQPRAQEPTAG